MKKLFTLLAFLTCFLGANAKEVVDLEIDYSTVTSWNGGWRSDAAAERVSIQDGAIYFHSEEATENLWDVQFQLPGVASVTDATYTITLRIKGTVEQPIHGGFSGSNNVDIPVTTDWNDVVLEGLQNNPTAQYFANSGCLLLQCGDYIGEWWISYIKVTHEERDNQRPVEWVELLENGNAETPWTEDQKNIAFDDQDKNFTICAWGKTKGRNVNDDGGSDPFAADIEEDPADPSNHVFVVHAAYADTEGDASAWDNQFWIQAPKQLKQGMQYKLHFRYKASQDVSSTDTQMHHQNPSNYSYHNSIGNIAFTTEWQDYDGTPTVNGEDCWSFAFNLNSVVKDAVDFYFDELSICEMKLDHGYFVAGANTDTGLEYNYDEAVEFTEEDGLLVATVGQENDESTWVNQIMVSTVRGNDAAFKSNTLKPSGTPKNDPEEFLDYETGSSAKITLPGSGVWKVYILEEYAAMAFELLKGTEKAFEEINPNPTEIIINTKEREYTTAEAEAAGVEAPDPAGQPWDNQFWIVSNEELTTGESVTLQFKYRSTAGAKTTTQLHSEPGNYVYWNAIGEVNFDGGEEWQEFDKTWDIASGDGGASITIKSIAFNLSEIKEANEYHIKDVVWKLADGTKSLIDQTGTKNFFVKVLGEDPHEFGTESGINELKANAANNGAIFNIAGQKVDENYKGLVIKSGKKLIQK